MTKYVLDACALIAYFNHENGSDIVEQILLEENERYVSIINVFEVCYDLERNSKESIGLGVYEDIQKLPITVIDTIDSKQIEHAIYFKNNFKISVADSFALGLAKKLSGILITADHHEFDPIDESRLLDFLWIR